MSLHNDSQHNISNASTAAVKTKKKRLLILTIIPIVIIFAAMTTFMMWPSNVNRQEAVEIALERVGGGSANWPSRDFERFQRTWSVEVFHDGLVHEVFISMRTGQIVKVEVDKWD